MWRQLESGRVQHRFEPIVIAATLALIPVLVIEVDAKSSGWQDFATAMNWLIWAIFLAELVFILTVAPRKKAALRAHWLDAVIVVVTAPPFGRFLSSLRLLRLARLLRLLRLSAIVSRLVQRERTVTSGDAFRIAALVTVLIVVIGGAAQALVDHGDFNSTWDGIWWAVETVTTVGYGDHVPTTVGGRLIGMGVMFVGIGFISLLTATVASRFVRTERGAETEELLAALQRIEGELAEMKQRMA
jgi:voltage-gated potassium channel